MSDDDETLPPTMSLRYVLRPFAIAAPSFGGVVLSELRPVLQQRFTTPNGSPLWRDVPTVEEKT